MLSISTHRTTRSVALASSEPTATLDRQPPGTVSMLFHRIPVEGVPRAWRKVPLDLHLDVELQASTDGAVSIVAPMRSGLVARIFGSKFRKMGVLPDHAAAVVQRKWQEGARVTARLVDAPPPRLREREPNLGFFLSIRCKA